MISNQVLQSTIEGLKTIMRIDLCIMDTEGKPVASTYAETGNYEAVVRVFAESPLESQIVQNYQLFKIYDEYHLEYVLLVHDGSEEAHTFGRMAAFQIQSLLVAYKERFDKDNFIKNLLLDNLLLVDIYNRAKKLHIDTNVRRVIFIMEIPTDKDTNMLERVRSLLGTKNEDVQAKDFITAVDEKNIIVVKQVMSSDGYPEMEKVAQEMLNVLKSEGISNLHVAYGTIVNDIKEVSKSYKEASRALDVGRIFYSERNILAYNELGIGRLIHQLPYSLCDMFLKEVFDGRAVEQFDEETLSTVNLFFENNLNISETARKLYVHRNTLVYRLEKIQKITGLDVRVFDDALTFKIALMVTRHMNSAQ